MTGFLISAGVSCMAGAFIALLLFLGIRGEAPIELRQFIFYSATIGYAFFAAGIVLMRKSDDRT